MRLEELVPERMIWSLGSVALVMAAALFAYEMLRPEVAAQANDLSRRFPTVESAQVVGLGKQSPFAEANPGEVLVKLPELSWKYQKKVFYLWQPAWKRR